MVFVLNATYTAFFLYISALMEPHLISSGKTLLNDRLDNLPLYLTTKKKVSWHTSYSTNASSPYFPSISAKNEKLE